MDEEVGLVVLLGFLLNCAIVVTAFYILERRIIMGVNEVLAGVKAALVEATEELVGKINELEAQLAEKDTVDPALLAEVAALAGGLAAVVDEAAVVEVPAEEVPVEGTPEPA